MAPGETSVRCFTLASGSLKRERRKARVIAEVTSGPGLPTTLFRRYNVAALGSLLSYKETRVGPTTSIKRNVNKPPRSPYHT